MRLLLASLGGYLLLSAALSAAPCAPSPTALCLNDSRFKVEVSWRDSRGRTGVGQAKSITADTGYFWFFSETNIELVIKVLDARSINQKFWVFFGALTSVEFDLSVTDTVTGAVKTYHNALGTFASVGDTGAFDPAVTAPTLETVTSEGTSIAPESLEAIQKFIEAPAPQANAAFTPCLGPSASLGLSNCRFLLRVDWRDARGRTGQGQAVQLTNDTGYFWFFSPSNVELVVKVLDARSVNGNFWVFYGALSNVEYDLSVTDMLTGVVKSYGNPAGTLASVGDTAAFASGTSVVAVKDDPRAVSADIDENGGTINATAADGSTFTLEIPPDALFFPRRITMTPLHHVDGFPFTGGATAGVQLEPEGLFLWKPAILTIQAAVPPPDPAAGVTYSYRGGGEEFIVYPREPNTNQVRLHVSHFSGYGEGIAITPGDLEDLTYCEAVKLLIAAKLRTSPARRFDGYVQRTAQVYLAQACDEISPVDLLARLRAIWEEAWGDLVYPALQGLKETCEPASFEPTLLLAFEYLHCIDSWITDPAFSQFKRDLVYAMVKEISLKCIDKAYQSCKENHDFSPEAKTILNIRKALQLAGLLDEEEAAQIGEKLDKCIRFELSFDTALTVASTQAAAPVIEKFRLGAKVPLRLDGSHHYIVNGEAPLNYQVLQGSYTNVPCTLTYTTTPGTFHVERMAVDGLSLNFDSILNGLKFNADIIYEPGSPERAPTIHCPGNSATLPSEGRFKQAYQRLHSAEFIAEGRGYIFLKWEPILDGALIAKKKYFRSIHDRGEDELDEETTFILKHTPE